jgi:1-acyl-sn-glycerol-3-phosphate acyltransferase
MQLLASLLFTTFLFISTGVFSVAVLLSGIFPYRVRHAVVTGWASSLLWLLKRLCRLDYSVEGRKHIPAGNHISMWKHSSSWETIAQMVVFPPQAWVLKHELMWIPILGWAIRLMRPIAIDRGSGHVAVNQVLEQGKQRLDAGMWVLVFPEGTRMAPGKTRKYGISGALLATQTGKLVVPVAHNAGRYWPRRGLIKRPGTIRVVIGKPFDPAGLEPRELNQRVQEWIESTVARLERE